MVAFGSWWGWIGWSIVQVERGWSAVIAGSVIASAGLLLIGLAAVMSRVDALNKAVRQLAKDNLTAYAPSPEILRNPELQKPDGLTASELPHQTAGLGNGVTPAEIATSVKSAPDFNEISEPARPAFSGTTNSPLRSAGEQSAALATAVAAGTAAFASVAGSTKQKSAVQDAHAAVEAELFKEPGQSTEELIIAGHEKADVSDAVEASFGEKAALAETDEASAGIESEAPESVILLPPDGASTEIKADDVASNIEPAALPSQKMMACIENWPDAPEKESDNIVEGEALPPIVDDNVLPKLDTEVEATVSEDRDSDSSSPPTAGSMARNVGALNEVLNGPQNDSASMDRLDKVEQELTDSKMSPAHAGNANEWLEDLYSDSELTTNAGKSEGRESLEDKVEVLNSDTDGQADTSDTAPEHSELEPVQIKPPLPHISDYKDLADPSPVDEKVVGDLEKEVGAHTEKVSEDVVLDSFGEDDAKGQRENGAEADITESQTAATSLSHTAHQPQETAREAVEQTSSSSGEQSSGGDMAETQPAAPITIGEKLVDGEMPEKPPLLRSYESQGITYFLYTDGSIEAQTPAGLLSFASLQELRGYIEQRAR